MAVAILSPHLDDAVLSCWRALTADSDVAIVTVFAGIPPDGLRGWWDEWTGRHDSAALMRERREEDRRAVAGVGATAIHLDFLDKQYRTEPQPVETLVAALRDRIPAGCKLLAPAGLGDHLDHLLVRRAALGLCEAGYGVELYADLPHASRMVARMGVRLTDDELRAKLATVREYASQLGALEQLFGHGSSFDDLLAYEVSWRLPARARAA
jgi:LmbE family N-acetylglucosaminyl deacetylase